MYIAVCQLNTYFPLQTDSKLNIYMDESGKHELFVFPGSTTLIHISEWSMCSLGQAAEKSPRKAKGKSSRKISRKWEPKLKAKGLKNPWKWERNRNVGLQWDKAQGNYNTTGKNRRQRKTKSKEDKSGLQRTIIRRRRRARQSDKQQQQQNKRMKRKGGGKKWGETEENGNSDFFFL